MLMIGGGVRACVLGSARISNSDLLQNTCARAADEVRECTVFPVKANGCDCCAG